MGAVLAGYGWARLEQRARSLGRSRRHAAAYAVIAAMTLEYVAVPVDLATQADVTKLKAGMKDAKGDAPLAGKSKEQKREAVKEKSANP